jgi:hypothetical protein
MISTHSKVNKKNKKKNKNLDGVVLRNSERIRTLNLEEKELISASVIQNLGEYYALFTI